MKRLRSKLAAKIASTFGAIRKRRRILLAEWVPGDINDPNLVQEITDIMATGGHMQIEYNGEWKTIEPYGWNSSKAGNVLLMCYKDTGEVRSYRLDRMTNVQFDPDVIDLSQYGLAEDGDSNGQGEVEEIDGVEVPTLEDGGDESITPGENQEQETPFENAIDVLEAVDDEFKVEDFREDNNNEAPVDPFIEETNPVEESQTEVEPQLEQEQIPEQQIV